MPYLCLSMKIFKIVFVFLLMAGSALKAQLLPVFTIKDTQGKAYNLSELKNNKASVLVFMSPECPICQKYTLTINQLAQAYEAKGVKFYAVFPGKNFKKKDINTFAKEYAITMPLLLDPSYALTKGVGATVTPQVQLFNPTGEMLYSGKVDNWYEDIGKRRTVITEKYLEDAMDALLAGTPVKVKQTNPVGCFIF
jgi:peroxiredoxin